MKPKLRVVHFSFADSRGANRAAYLVHKGLQSLRHDSVMLVRKKSTSDPSVFEVGNNTLGEVVVAKLLKTNRLGLAFTTLSKRIRKKLNRPIVTFNEDRDRVDWRAMEKNIRGADLVCLHFVDNFLSVNSIRKIFDLTNAPIVWTMMDMEPITGGCHFAYECNGYKKKCGKCPQLFSKNLKDMSRELWQKKRRLFGELPVTVVAPTQWLEKKALKSSLGKLVALEKILLSVDTKIFKPGSKKMARKRLGLPVDKKIILVGARDIREKRKGMGEFVASLKKLKKRMRVKDVEKILVVSLGNKLQQIDRVMKHRFDGMVADQKRLVDYYVAADVFACPSIEDAGPMMINEAVMCGTPVVAFEMGVAPDLITSKSRGYVAKLGDVEDFARGLKKVLKRKGEQKSVEQRCKPKVQAREYEKLFNRLLKSR